MATTDVSREQFLKRSSSDDTFEHLFPQQLTNSRLLNLPRKIRLKIWKRVHYKHFDILRLLCRSIKDDIDHHVGISIKIDDREKEFFEQFESIGIRHANIVNLSSSKVTAKLQHPELLAELTIKGTISANFFSYFMKNCKNISSFNITFTKLLVSQRPLFFPQTFQCLPGIKSLKCISHTKSTKDLVYVCENMASLFKDTLDYGKPLVELNLVISHKAPSPYLDEISMEAFMLAFRNNRTLQQLVIIIREYTTNTPGEGQEDGSNDKPSGPGSNRRGTEMVNKKHSVFIPHTPPAAPVISAKSSEHYVAFKEDKRNSDLLESAEKFLSGKTWPPFPYLKVAIVILNSQTFHHAEQFLPMAVAVKHLKMEICGGDYSNGWHIFKTITQSICKTVTSIKLANISYENYMKVPLDLDFSIFQPCKSLRQLHLSCPKRETHQMPRARNVSSLPQLLTEIEIYWMTLSSWQWFRLLCCFKKLETLTVGYISRTDGSFGCFLTILRWQVVLHMTQVQQLVMTDFKIRFRNKRSNIKKLQKSIPVQVEYRDKEETLLILDRGPTRKESVHSIPSIQSE